MITTKAISGLIEDIAYLKDEVNALKKVITEIPYQEKPLDGDSIMDLLYDINEKQSACLQVLNELPKSGKEIQASNFIKDPGNIMQLLSLLASKRKELETFLKDKKLGYFEINIQNSDQELTVYEFLTGMVKEERKALRRIADLVLAYQTDRMFQRQLRAGNRN